jgi:two-component system, cell cycle sensor histidine kinase and response regulator CckA
MSMEAARILVVEDNRDTSALLRDLLEAEGYAVESSLTGEHALEVLTQNPDVDLLVLDLMLPGMSGYDVIERLRSSGDLASIPVLVLSALSSTSARIRGLRDGADDYMTKPFLPEELLARTRTLVTSRLLERRTRELQALGQIAQASLTAMSAEVLLQRIVEITAEVVGADFAALFLSDDVRHELHARAVVGLDVPLTDLSMSGSEGLGNLAITTGEPVLIQDGASHDPRVTNRVVRALGIRSVMVAPLVVGGSAVGLLEVGRRARRLDPRADRLLRIIADRVAIALEHTRLESEARELADVVRRIGEGVVVADPDERIRFANAAFAGMVGADAEGLPGRRWTEFLAAAQDTTALTERMHGSTFEGEVLLITRSGEPRPVFVSLSTVPRESGRPERIGVFRDISREHELRFRVIREQKFRTLGSLAAGVAHNINNRLTPVLGWTEMLLERLAAGETLDRSELVHALTVINQGAADSVGTVRRLQEYARPGRVKGPEAVQLRDVLEHLLALTRPQWDNEAARRGIRYEIDLKIEPAPAILAVASEIREAILNILENALAAMPRGGRLTMNVRGVDTRAILSITDTGMGMSEEVQRLAFEPFFTTRAGEGGSGLGLALAQEIVQRYGGTIALRSAEGIGTTFTLSFPAITAEPRTSAVFLPSLEPLKILAVEDEPEVLDLVRAMLSYAGHTVFTAASGREALDLFRREAIDLVVTDLGMPGMTGLVLAEELKRLRPVPIVLLTGWADEVDATQVPHIDVVIAKPATRERLLDAIARAVPQRLRPA